MTVTLPARMSASFALTLAITAEDYGPYSTMKHKGSELAPLGTFEKKVPAEVMAKVQAKEADIRAGKVIVKVDDEQPKSTAK